MPYLPIDIKKYITYDGKKYKCSFCKKESLCSPCLTKHILKDHIEEIKKRDKK